MAQINKYTEVDKFITRCRETKLSVTPQRLSIYKALMNDVTHPSPEAVYNKIRKEHPTISLATVYKTLETFEKNDIISLVTPIHNTVRYDPVTYRHDHMICIRCKKVMDVPQRESSAIEIPASLTGRHRLVTYSVHFNVICSDCLKHEH